MDDLTRTYDALADDSQLHEISTMLLRFVRRYHVPAQQMYDLAQDTLVVLLQKDDPKRDFATAKRFALGILRNKIRQYFTRTAGLDRGVHERGLFSPRSAHTSVSSHVDRNLRLLAAVDSLDDEEREAFLLRCEGYQIAEIAEATNISPATVKRRLDRARVPSLPAWCRRCCPGRARRLRKTRRSGVSRQLARYLRRLAG